MGDEKQLVDGTYLLQKFTGKGGWTYAAIPRIKPDKESPFGWVQVRGSIDSFELKQYKLMPMGNGKLFLPVKAEIRKKIKKEAGDTVRVTLFLDRSEFQIPREILECFELESPTLLKRLKELKNWEQKAYIDWIYKSKKEETRANRIAEMMRKLEMGRRFHEKI